MSSVATIPDRLIAETYAGRRRDFECDALPSYRILPGTGTAPLIMWAYPREFKNADAAAQLTDSPCRFLRFNWGTPLYFLTQGYAVLDGPTMPIVGEGDEQPNDTYVEQLVASARAAVEEVVRRGVGDRDRLAIGGHSYGAFMTANLLGPSPSGPKSS